MKLTLTASLLLTLIAFSASAQTITDSTLKKECNLAGGSGVGGGDKNSKLGWDTWLQMNYRLSRLFSVGTEFEYIEFERPVGLGYPSSLDAKRKIFDNYVSFIIKYHLPVKTKFQLSAACGWTYHILQESLTYYQTTNTSRYRVENRTHYSNFAIPFIAEAYYPLGSIFRVGVRGKYNLNANNTDDDTYSAGLAISIKL